MSHWDKVFKDGNKNVNRKAKLFDDYDDEQPTKSKDRRKEHRPRDHHKREESLES